MSRLLLVAICLVLCLAVAPLRTEAQTPVAAPTIDSVTAGDGQLTISWTAPAGVTGITAYDLRYIETSADETVAANWTEVERVWTMWSGCLDYVLSGLTNGTGYDVQVRTVTATDGAWSGTATGMPQMAVSTDANLSALSVGGKSVAGFDAETTSYHFGVASTVTQATVAGVAADASATVDYSGTDADSATDGHQVDLSVGCNAVTVTAGDGATTRFYAVSVNRGSDAPFGWNAEYDFDNTVAAGNDEARGLWSDDTTMWVADYNSDRAFAYSRSTKERDPDKDFLTIKSSVNDGPEWISGIWSNGTTMWVADPVYDRIYAYVWATLRRDPDKDIYPKDGKWSASADTAGREGRRITPIAVTTRAGELHRSAGHAWGQPPRNRGAAGIDGVTLPRLITAATAGL